MIADTLAGASRYAALHPAFTHAFAWLGAFDAAIPDGNHPIGLGCEARVMSYRTAPAESRRWESHRRYIDIQCVVRGRERMDVANVASLTGATPYDDANDVLFYDGTPAGATALLVEMGGFAIFFPHDGHRPSIAIDAPEDVRKIVIKVPVLD
ncbi:MAG: YhcH/YjgK/YiaL family protein [Proteobacteria bacterium]|nr:YhcH/YjgK/YiaL family protein [Pseudomonadota bacterium]